MTPGTGLFRFDAPDPTPEGDPDPEGPAERERVEPANPWADGDGEPDEDPGADDGGGAAEDPWAELGPPLGAVYGAPEPAAEGAGAAVGPLAPVPDLLEGLNEAQLAAVTHGAGPLLILAGPGSGKTRVITRRIVYLLTERGARPSEVLAITFTNKAAREMRERVEGLIGPTKGLWISTFHAMCARILRRDIEVLGGWTRDFTIWDTSDRNQLLKRLIKEAGYDTTRFRPAMIGSQISAWKNQVAGDPVDDGGIEDEVLLRVRERYQAALRESNALDFDDLLLRVLQIFEEHPGVRDQYARRFRQVMVDEYQDTNRVQYLLTRHLSAAHGNLAVCGDPDQAIYSWRGADVRNILDFETDYPAATVVKLEENYRSVNNVLRAAQTLIEHNSSHKPRELYSAGPDGEKLVVIECGDENDEALEIAAQVRGLVAQGRSYADVAVFYRVNFMQRALEQALRLSGVPYRVVGGLEFYARREIRDLLAYLRLVVNPRDDVAFRRVVNVPQRGVGQKSLDSLAEQAVARGLSLWDAVQSEACRAGIRGRAKKGLAEFGTLLVELGSLADAAAGVALSALLASLDVSAWLAQMDDDGGPDRQENVRELQTYADEFDLMAPGAGLRGFLQDVALVSETDGTDGAGAQVTLMTLHAAKGLEFPVVFVAGLEEDVLPHARAIGDGAAYGGDERGLEEERRLFFVGLTRARERLFLTHARVRRFFGQESWQRPSRFLEELPPELIEGQDPEGEATDVLGVYEAPAAGPALAVGARVEHDHFGRGTVERLAGSGVNARASVHFPLHGSKELLLCYAKLRVVEA